MSIAAALAELEKSAALPEHIAALQELISREGQRRERFRRDHADRRGEFINGQVCVASAPTSGEAEAEAVACIRALLAGFAACHPPAVLLGHTALCECQRNDYQPDACFFGAARAAAVTPAARTCPPPDLAVEVLTPATADHDRNLKWEDYARHGVTEYWIVNPADRFVEQYVLRPGSRTYDLRARLAAGGRLESAVLAGFAVPVAALFDRPLMEDALAALRQTGPLSAQPL